MTRITSSRSPYRSRSPSGEVFLNTPLGEGQSVTRKRKDIVSQILPFIDILVNKKFFPESLAEEIKTDFHDSRARILEEMSKGNTPISSISQYDEKLQGRRKYSLAITGRNPLTAAVQIKNPDETEIVWHQSGAKGEKLSLATFDQNPFK